MTQDWTLEEALAYYRRQGAPGEQGALVALLREVQEERGGALPAAAWSCAAAPAAPAGARPVWPPLWRRPTACARAASAPAAASPTASPAV